MEHILNLGLPITITALVCCIILAILTIIITIKDEENQKKRKIIVRYWIFALLVFVGMFLYLIFKNYG